MVSETLIDKVMAFTLRQGELGVTREDYFAKIPEISASDLEEALTILEDRALIKRDWADQVNYRARSTLPGLIGLPTMSGAQGNVAYATPAPEPLTQTPLPRPPAAPSPPPPPAGSAGQGASQDEQDDEDDEEDDGSGRPKRRVLAKPGTQADRPPTASSRADAFCPFLKRGCRSECMLYIPERHVCSIHAIASEGNLAEWVKGDLDRVS